MKKISEKIFKVYQRLGRKYFGYTFQKNMEKKLCAINPGIDKENLVRQYYVEKISKLIGFSVLLILILIVSCLSDVYAGLTNSQPVLERPDYDGVDRIAKMKAEYESAEYEFDLNIKRRKYTQEESYQLYKDLADKLPDIIQNNSEKLNLVGKVTGYPFSIRWESKNYDVIQEDGTIINDKDEFKTTKVDLIAYLTYEEFTYEEIITVTVFPKKYSIEEKQKKEIITSILKNENESEQYLQLPTYLEDKPIMIKEIRKSVTGILAIIFLVMLVGIWIGSDNDLTKKYKERNRLLCLEYSEFVSKLQLLIGSGMTLRMAFERMGEDYKLLKENGYERKYVYEELLLCIRQMRDGSSEEECYEQFGRRCELSVYRKLAILLTQNLRKGTRGLLIVLSNESKWAFEERKQIAKRAGEEAQTKLLFPMIMMFSVVIILIMLPAYISFGL